MDIKEMTEQNKIKNSRIKLILDKKKPSPNAC